MDIGREALRKILPLAGCGLQSEEIRFPPEMTINIQHLFPGERRLTERIPETAGRQQPLPAIEKYGNIFYAYFRIFFYTIDIT